MRHLLTLATLVAFSIVPLAAQGPGAALRGANVAVSCFPLHERAAPAARSLQAKLEEILGDNGVRVLDETKAADMRQGYHLLADPTVVVTAELLVELREKYKIDRLLNVYFDCDVTTGIAEFFTATGHADLRLIDTAARVEARVSRPMGVVGNPGSDAVTAGAARLNALERAIDEAAGGLGLKIATPAEPRLIRLALEPVSSAGGAALGPLAAPARAEMTAWAKLQQQTWEQEKPTLTVVSPDGNYGAVATYIWSQRMGSRRIFGSRLHIVDTKARGPVATYDFSPLAIPAPYEKKGKEILAASFLGGWRFLLAVNANEIVLWDVERGRELSRLLHVGGGGPVELAMGRQGEGSFVRVRAGRAEQTFRLAVAR